jgi:putative phosphoesterase
VAAVGLVVLADTHVPKRARDLPPEVWSAVERADVVVHAGDWVTESLYDELDRRSKTLLAVWGNNDPQGLRRRIPEVARAEIGGLRVGVVHETGPAQGREERCARRFPGLDVLVFGHSHIPWDTRAGSGLRLLNPGSPTDRARSRAAPTSPPSRRTASCAAWSCGGCRCVPSGPVPADVSRT